jgi:hypothetical protein
MRLPHRRCTRREHGASASSYAAPQAEADPEPAPARQMIKAGAALSLSFPRRLTSHMMQPTSCQRHTPRSPLRASALPPVQQFAPSVWTARGGSLQQRDDHEQPDPPSSWSPVAVGPARRDRQQHRGHGDNPALYRERLEPPAEPARTKPRFAANDRFRPHRTSLPRREPLSSNHHPKRAQATSGWNRARFRLVATAGATRRLLLLPGSWWERKRRLVARKTSDQPVAASDGPSGRWIRSSAARIAASPRPVSSRTGRRCSLR